MFEGLGLGFFLRKSIDESIHEAPQLSWLPTSSAALCRGNRSDRNSRGEWVELGILGNDEESLS